MSTQDMAGEQALVRRAQAGDAEAFDQLVLAHQARLRAYVARFVVCSQDAYDIVQDACIDAFRGLKTMDPDRPFGPWIRGVCRNHLYDFLRRRTREPSTSAPVEAVLASLAPNDEADLDAEERRLAALEECLEGLQEEHRELIALRYLHATPLQELASSARKTTTALAMMLMRIRGKLRECVTERVRGAEA